MSYLSIIKVLVIILPPLSFHYYQKALKSYSSSKMQFSISTILALGLSLSLTHAAPARRAPLADVCAELGQPANCVTFCGADTASCFAALFTNGADTAIRKFHSPHPSSTQPLL